MSNVAVYCGKKSDRLVNVVLEREGGIPLFLKLVNASGCAQVCIVYVERDAMEPVELERTFIEGRSVKHVEVKGPVSTEIRREYLAKIRIAFIHLENKVEQNKANDRDVSSCHGEPYQVTRFVSPIPEPFRLIAREEFPSSELRMEQGHSSADILPKGPTSFALAEIQKTWTLGFRTKPQDADKTRSETRVEQVESATPDNQDAGNKTREPCEQLLCNDNGPGAQMKSGNATEAYSMTKRNNGPLCQVHWQHVEDVDDVIRSAQDIASDVLDYVCSLFIDIAMLITCYLAVKIITS